MTARVEIRIPTMLAGLIGGVRRVAVDAGDIADAIEALIELQPALRVHILDESSHLRPHVTLFHNDRQAHDWSVELTDGDTLTVLQAVSGG
jgi:molybdopterin converting factor small subunit